MSWQIELPADAEGPITATVARRIKPGHEAAFEDFLLGIGDVARTFPGYLGAEVFRPAGGESWPDDWAAGGRAHRGSVASSSAGAGVDSRDQVQHVERAGRGRRVRRPQPGLVRLARPSWTVYRLIKECELVSVKVRNGRRVPVESLRAYIAA